MSFGDNASWRSRATIIFCWSAFFSSHFARMNWAVIMPFAESPLGLTNTLSGLVVTATFLAYAIMQIPAGIIADRINNERLMGVSLVATGLITCLTGLTGKYVEILALRLLTGFAASFVYSPALRLISLSFPMTKKGKALGLFYTAPFFALIVLGVVVPPLALSNGWQYGFIVSGIPCIVTGVTLLLSFKKINKQVEKVTSYDSSTSIGSDIKETLLNRNLQLCFIASFLGGFSISGVKIWLLDYIVTDVGFAGGLAGLLYSAFNFLTVLNKPASGWVNDKLNRRKPIIVGSLLTAALFYFLIAVSAGTTASIGFILCSGLVEGFHIPSQTALVSEICSKRNLGMALSTQNMMSMMAYVVQPALAGYILDQTGMFSWVWAMFAATCLLPALLFSLVHECRR